MFQPIKAGNAIDDIVEQIEKAIFDKTYQPGQRLPPERTLEKQFNASRATIRIALRVLVQKGLVEIKTGSKGGAYIIDSYMDRIADQISLSIKMGKISFGQISQFRFAVETAAFELAIQMCEKKDIEHLEILLARMKKDLDGGKKRWRQFYVLESLMHQYVVSICQNPLFEHLLKIVHRNLWKYYEMLPRRQSFLNSLYQEWQEFLEVMRQKDVFRGKILIRSHLLTSDRCLNTYKTQNNLGESDMSRHLHPEV